jgi:hypothetical protein
MICPLCKAEFREGFTRCSDCDIDLVSPQSVEAVSGASLLWKGDDRRKCNQILDAVTAAGIPSHSTEALKKQAWPWISVLLFRFMRPRPTFELRVSVLGKDLARAQTLVRELQERWRKAEEWGDEES